MPLPPEAQKRIVRAMGAYVRSTPQAELPRVLKRWRGLRDQALVARRDEVVAALEDSAVRLKLREWLDLEPSIDKNDARALAIACDRSDGWKDELANLASPVRTKSAPRPKEGDATTRLQREREKTRQAREDARRAVRRARDESLEHQKKTQHLEEQVTRLERDLVDARRRASTAETAEARVRAQLEREQRRSKSSAQKLRDDNDRLKSQVRDLRVEVRRLTQQAKTVERKSPPDRPVAARDSAGKRARVRKPLTAPAGLLEDAPETLRAWMESSAANLLIDGYNVSKAHGAFGDLDLESQRRRLVQEVDRLARRYRLEATIVFDGSDDVGGLRRRRRGAVRTEYSSAGETADDHLVDLLESLGTDPVIVVTNDKDLQERARARGATIATSDQLIAQFRPA